MKRAAAMFAVFAAVCAFAAPPVCDAPFRLPPSARLSERNAGGWQGTGEIARPLAAAELAIGAAARAAGWRHVHTIRLSRGSGLETWRRGSEELTLMLRRKSPRSTEFSFGVSKIRKGGDGR